MSTILKIPLIAHLDKQNCKNTLPLREDVDYYKI